MNHFQMKLRWKLIVVLLPAMVLFLVLPQYWMVRSVEGEVMAQLMEDFRQEGFLVSRILDSGSSEAQSDVVELSSILGCRISVIRADGQVLADSRGLEVGEGEQEYLTRYPEVERAFIEGVGQGTGYDPDTFEYSAFLAFAPGEGEFAVLLSMPLTQPTQPFRGVWVSQLWYGILAVGAGLLLVWVLSGSLERSIRRLSSAADSVGNGKFVSEIAVGSGTELGDLARKMEEMSVKLRSQIELLRADQQYLTTILNSMTEGVMVTDLNGRITASNPAFRRIFGLDDDAVGRMPVEVIRHPTITQAVESTLEGDVEREYEIRFDRQILLARLAPIRSGEDPRGVVAVFHDVSERRRLEGLRTEFVSNVSHELKTPLTSIQGYAETLMEEEGLDQIHKSFAGRIFRNASHLSDTIEQLLSLARLEKGESQINWVPVSFAALMSELHNGFSDQFRFRGLAFRFIDSTGLDQFFAGERYMAAIFRNLIENAIKYTDQGTICVRMDWARDEGLLFSVQDSGIGIREKDLERIFERFYRVDGARGRSSGGSGIGLAIVKHMVQLHGGRVWAESIVGKGTKVCFTLPHRDPLGRSGDEPVGPKLKEEGDQGGNAKYATENGSDH